MPGRLHSDNGMEFCASVVQALCKAFSVEPLHGAVGRPQTQGCVERAHQIFKYKLNAQLMMAATDPSWVFQVGAAALIGWQKQCSWGTQEHC